MTAKRAPEGKKALGQTPTPIVSLLADFPRIVAEAEERGRAKKALVQKPKKPRRPNFAGAKGKANENMVAAAVRCVWQHAARNLEQTRSGGRDLLNTWPFCFELKHHKAVSIQAALKQAKAAARADEIPAVITKDNGGEQLFTCRLADILPKLSHAFAYENSVAIELVVGTEEDEAEAEKALSPNDAEAKKASSRTADARTLPLFKGAV